MLYRIAVLVGISFALVLEGHGVPADRVSDTQSSPLPGHFVDVTEKLGIHFRQQASPTSKKYLLETMGSGVALFDYDNDGRLDIFFANGARLDDPTAKGSIPRKDSPKYWNRLYHQKPDGTFEDVTEHA
ncbi:MAG: VCBS repeat-containing protein, partial [Terriglobales bacterium]